MGPPPPPAFVDYSPGARLHPPYDVAQPRDCRRQSKEEPIRVFLNFCSRLLNELTDVKVTISSLRQFHLLVTVGKEILSYIFGRPTTLLY